MTKLVLCTKIPKANVIEQSRKKLAFNGFIFYRRADLQHCAADNSIQWHVRQQKSQTQLKTLTVQETATQCQ